MKYVLLFIIHECLHTSESDLCVNLDLIRFLFFRISRSTTALESVATSEDTMT